LRSSEPNKVLHLHRKTEWGWFTDVWQFGFWYFSGYSSNQPKKYVMHSQVIIDHLLYCQPVILNQKGDMQGSLRSDCGWFLDWDACVKICIPSPFRTRYSVAPSTKESPLSTYSMLISWGMICWAYLIELCTMVFET
jgi:hypothetical protein